MFELAVVLVLVVVNGLFSLSELAVVSARRARLRAMADEGRPGAAAAISLAEDPGRFLSTVQIGITLVGVLAGAFSGSALGGKMTSLLAGVGVPQEAAEAAGFFVVVALVTYLSIVVGELVPKRIALRDPEAVACRVAPLMRVVSRVAAPVVWLLDASSSLLSRLLGFGGQADERVTDEDLRALVNEAERHGTIETAEGRMISGVLRLGDRPVKAVMTPRSDVDWIDLSDSEAAIREVLMRTMHSRLPVGDGSPDAMIGVVQSRELLAAMLRGDPLDVRRATRVAPVVPDTSDTLDMLATLRAAEVPMALVHDEYGHFEGIVTPTDLTGFIVGDFRSDLDEPAAVRREDGSWLLSGWMPADEMADLLLIALPAERRYQTVAGFVLHAMGHFPRTGEAAQDLGWRFEVVDTDGRRIDKVLAVAVERNISVDSLRPGAGHLPGRVPARGDA